MNRSNLKFLKQMSSGDEQDSWIEVQKRTFTNWSNNVLLPRNLKIGDLETDLKDGIAAIYLFEELTKKKAEKYNKVAKMRIPQCENIGIALKIFQADGLKLVNISPEDINDGNLKIILGFIWSLIIRYQILTDEYEKGSPKALLLEWCNRQLENYKSAPKNFRKDWSDGSVICDLVDSFNPGILSEEKRQNESLQDVEMAMKVAENQLSIPRVLEPEHMVNAVDDLSTMTYVSYFKDMAEKMEATPCAAKSIADGPGIMNTTDKQSPHSFDVKIRSRAGKILAKDNVDHELLSVKIAGPWEDDEILPRIGIHDGDKAIYPVEYEAKQPGDYEISVTFDNEHIKDSPFLVQIARTVKAVASNSFAEGSGLEKAYVDLSSPITIHVKDENGEPFKDKELPFSIKLSPNCHHETEIRKDGSYDLSYIPNAEGEHEISISVNGEPIKDSPWSIDVKQGANLKESFAAGLGLKNARVTRPSKFTIHSLDKNGEYVEDEMPFTTKFSPDCENEMLNNGDGTYDVIYTPTEEKPIEISVFLDKKPLNNSP